MGKFRRLFRKCKKPQADDDSESYDRERKALLRQKQAHEKEQERLWLDAWKVSGSDISLSSVLMLSEESSTRTTPLCASTSNVRIHSDLFFDTTPTFITSAPHPQKHPDILKFTADYGSAHQEVVTSARPPLASLTSKFLCSPRSQQYVSSLMNHSRPCVLTKDTAAKVGELEADPTARDYEKVREGCCCYRAKPCTSLRASISESIVPSLVYSETASSSSISAASQKTGSLDSLLQTKISKSPATHKCRSSTYDGYRDSGSRGNESETDPQVQINPHVYAPNRYIGSRSMSGPYPCVFGTRRPLGTSASKLSIMPTDSDYFP